MRKITLRIAGLILTLAALVRGTGSSKRPERRGHLPHQIKGDRP